MNNQTNYQRIFNRIWNSEVLTSAYELRTYYKNGLMLKYYPTIKQINKNLSSLDCANLDLKVLQGGLKNGIKS